MELAGFYLYLKLLLKLTILNKGDYILDDCFESSLPGIVVLKSIARLGRSAGFLWFSITHGNERIPSPASAFNVSDLNSSSPVAFLDFNPLIAVANSAVVKTSSSPKCVTFCMSRVDVFRGFKRSLKYSNYREGISFSSVECYLF